MIKKYIVMIPVGILIFTYGMMSLFIQPMYEYSQVFKLAMIVGIGAFMIIYGSAIIEQKHSENYITP